MATDNGQNQNPMVPTQAEASGSTTNPNVPSIAGRSGRSRDSVFGDTGKNTQDIRMNSINSPKAGEVNSSEEDISKLLELFLNTEATYLDLRDYMQRRRNIMVQEVQVSQQQYENVAQSLQLLPPAAQVALSALLTENLNIITAQQQEINRLDESVYPTREVLQQRFSVMYKANKLVLWQWIQEKQWPTIMVCRDLDLPTSICQLVLEPYPQENLGEAIQLSRKEKDKTIQDLERMIRTLQQEIKWKSEPTIKENNSTLPIKSTGSTATGESSNVVNMEIASRRNVFLERRRRTKIPTFEEGTAETAQKWIYRYESLCNYMGFDQQEKIEELCAVLLGHALTWFHSIQEPEKSNWEIVKTDFLHQYGEGANPTLAAMDELKRIRQGKSTIGVFAPQLKDILVRAQIFAPSVQLDFFKDRIHPDLMQAVTLGRATTLQEGIEIATEMERDQNRRYYFWSPNNMTTTSIIPDSTNGFYDGSNSGSSVNNQPTGEQQNYQGKPGEKSANEYSKQVRCYYCKKQGHIKKDCRKRLAREGQQQQQHSNQQEMVYE